MVFIYTIIEHIAKYYLQQNINYPSHQEDIMSGDWGVALPLLIFGGLSVVAGLLVLFLPETSNTILPDTVEDAKNFGR